MLAAGSPAPFKSTDWIGLRSMASASASRRRGSCAFEFAEKTSASNSTGSDNEDDVPCRCGAVGRLRRRFDHVGLVQFERDGLVAQRFAEFDLDRVHKRTPRPTIFICGELEQFPRLPLGDEERAGADWKMPFVLRLSKRLRGSASSASSDGMGGLTLDRYRIRRCTHIPDGMECAQNLRDGRGRRGAAVVELHSAAQRELPMTGARVTLPRHGQRGLRAALCIESYQSVADQRERARERPSSRRAWRWREGRARRAPIAS